jgi:hypothetical protein
MRLYQAVWTAADGSEHVSATIGTTDKNGDEPTASGAVASMFVAVPNWRSEPVVVFETFLH